MAASWTRRDLLKRAGLCATAAAVPWVVPGRVLGKNGGVAPSERITLGSIGLGWMGPGNLSALLDEKDCKVLAVCDIDKEHLDSARETRRPALWQPRLRGDRRDAGRDRARRHRRPVARPPRPLARHGRGARRPGRQGHVRRKTVCPQPPRRPDHGRHDQALRPRLADRELAALHGQFLSGRGDRAERADRQGQIGRGRTAVGRLQAQTRGRGRHASPRRISTTSGGSDRPRGAPTRRAASTSTGAGSWTSAAASSWTGSATTSTSPTGA